MKLAAKLLVFVVLVIVAVVAASFGRVGWSEALTNERTFTEPFAWFNSPEAISWGFELLFFFAFGMLVARLFQPEAPRLWAFAFGAICGALHFWLSRDHFASEAPWSLYVWAYGNYVMPAVGALLGALALQWVPNYSFKRTADVGLR